jgi:biotin carboxylase
MNKRILILGASPFQIPAIRHAVTMGCEVITSDYLSQNPGHRFAHQSFNISTVDQEAMLKLAAGLAIDGILAYASDPAAPTAAYVSERLGLPGTDPQAVHILTNKPNFRGFLKRHGFKVPAFSMARSCKEATAAAEQIGYPVMVKPVDSSGSKGLSRVDARDSMPDAIRLALEYSRSRQAIIEQYVRRQGQQVAGDGLVLEGRLVFFGFGDEHFDERCSPFAPVGESFPGTLDNMKKYRLMAELQRLFILLGIKNLVFNLDAAFDDQGIPFLIDIGPRSGGNFIPQIIRHYAGCDLTDCAIRFALGMPVDPTACIATPKGYFSTWVIHSRRAGFFTSLAVSAEIEPNLIQHELWAVPGDQVDRYRSSKDALGCALLAFSSGQEMAEKLSKMNGMLYPIIS